jgi:hypothetical protein
MIAVASSWVGTYALPASASPVALVMQMRGKSANVSLGQVTRGQRRSW